MEHELKWTSGIHRRPAGKKVITLALAKDGEARLEWWQWGGQCMYGTGVQKKNHHPEGAQLYDEVSIGCFLSRKISNTVTCLSVSSVIVAVALLILK